MTSGLRCDRVIASNLREALGLTQPKYFISSRTRTLGGGGGGGRLTRGGGICGMEPGTQVSQASDEPVCGFSSLSCLPEQK